ncbi:hypothetical protein A2468_05715 [Candidatus Falkowbacteria bacterium RIFOXYC2_FULL_46_15]|nr:MAG: hypothetical protein A2468_05715 [Candidatus Falkowbacteria bacterium RIFOXYC2_FULL_46_15]
MNIEFHIPVYNEERILEKNITFLHDYCRKNFGFDWSIAIIVNGSTDRSRVISERLAARYPERIRAEYYPAAGRGGAIRNSWLKSRADIVSYMDVDLAVDLKNINDLVEPILVDRADLVIGSRLLSNASIERSFIRELVSQSHLIISRLIHRHNFSDLQCGFKAVRRTAFAAIAPYVANKGWWFDTETILLAKLFDYRIAEIPVIWSENRYDKRKSKVNLTTDSLNALFNLIKLKFRLTGLKNSLNINDKKNLR